MSFWAIGLTVFFGIIGLAGYIFLELLKTSRFKGVVGEKVFQIFFKNLEKEYPFSKLYWNILLPTSNGETTQIDHVFFCKNGVFVIEQKTFDGWIFGSEHQKMWTQKFHRKSFQFQNPLRQNYAHCKALAEYLNISESKVFSVVVFSGECELKTNFPDNVMGLGNFKNYVQTKSEMLFGWKEIEALKAKLDERIVSTSKEHHQAHINRLKKRHS